MSARTLEEHPALVIGLQAAVPLHIAELKALAAVPRERTRLRWAAEAADALAHKGDVLQYGAKRGEAGEVVQPPRPRAGRGRLPARRDHVRRPALRVRAGGSAAGSAADAACRRRRQEPVMDQSTWPEHLRDDAPYQQCDRCGRKTWSRENFEGTCTMPRWNGTAWAGQCGGRLRSAL